MTTGDVVTKRTGWLTVHRETTTANVITPDKSGTKVPTKHSWLVSRIVRGMAEAPKEYRAWLKATEHDVAVDLAKEGKDQARLIVAMRDRETAQAARRAKAAWTKTLVGPFLFGGALWFTVVLMLVAAAGMGIAALMEKLRPKKAIEKAAVAPRAEHSSAFLHRLIVAATISAALTFADWYLHLSGVATLVWPGGATLIALIIIVIWVGPDGSIADNLADADPTPGAVHENAIIAALKAANPPNMPKHTDLMVVAPGVAWPVKDVVWQASVSTAKGDRGPSAKPILAVRDNFASELGVAPNRLHLEVDKDRGSRIKVTAVVGETWGDPSRSPLLELNEVDLWEGLPFGQNLVRERVTLPIFQRLYMFGGSSGGGKSTACTAVDCGFLMSRNSKLWIIDGGEVDTASVRNAGLAHRWTADINDALDILNELNAELERRQHLLVQFGVKSGNVDLGKKVSRQFFAEYGLGFDLLHFDEFASFTDSSDKETSKAIVKVLRSIIQRARKVGIIPLLATQSPSANALDSDARDVIQDRFALACKGWQMSEKILGQGNRARGVDASTLSPADKAGWLSLPSGDQVVRADLIEDEDLREIYRKAADLRGGMAVVRNLREVPTLLLATAQLMRQHEVDSMPTAEVVGRLRSAGHALDEGIVGQRALAAEMKRNGVSPVTDNTRSSDNRGKSHYLLSDLDEALRRLGHAA